MKKDFMTYTKSYMINNIGYTVQNRMCIGCGICEDVCPKQIICIVQKESRYFPVINEELCLENSCGKCLKVCPGIGINLKKLSQEFRSDLQQDNYIGRYVSLYTGYSLDKDIRYHSASGGLVTQFLIYLLEKKIVDGAVVTSFSEKDHLTPISYIARTKEDVLKARSSKYCPVALNKVGNEIVKSEGKYIIVGLPCHIQGFRKRAQIDKKFKERVIGYFAIYCSSNRTFNAQSFLLKKCNIQKDKVSSFAFRDNGCLGNLVIHYNKEKSEISIPFIQYYGRLRSFFKPRRCLSCIDHYGELADVSFGDIYVKPYSDDKIGINSCIVRNSFFNEVFRKAVSEGIMHLEPLDANILNESQKDMLYPKKRRVKALMTLDRVLGRKTVEYDISWQDIHPQIKDYISVISTEIQRFIGRHRSLWFIIDFLYSRK